MHLKEDFLSIMQADRITYSYVGEITVALCSTGGQDSIRAALVEADPAAGGALSLETLIEVFRIAAGSSSNLTKHQAISIHRHLSKDSSNGAVTTTALLQLFQP